MGTPEISAYVFEAMITFSIIFYIILSADIISERIMFQYGTVRVFGVA